MAVILYRQVGKGKARRYQRVNLGPGRPPTNLAGPYFLRYSLANGTRPWEPVGNDLDTAIDAQKRKQAYLGVRLPLPAPFVKAAPDAGFSQLALRTFTSLNCSNMVS